MRAADQRGFVRYHLPALLFALVIFVVSSLEQPPAPDYGLEWSDKINHLSAYGILAVLILRSVRRLRPNERFVWQASVAFILAAAYGFTDELHQSFVPGRSCELFDWLADLSGAIIGVIVARLLLRYALGEAIIGDDHVSRINDE